MRFRPSISPRFVTDSSGVTVDCDPQYFPTQIPSGKATLLEKFIMAFAVMLFAFLCLVLANRPQRHKHVYASHEATRRLEERLGPFFRARLLQRNYANYRQN